MNRLAGSLSSMAGRLFLILVLGMLAAAMTATWLADVRRRQEVASLGLTRTADRLQDVVELLDLASPELRERLLASGGPGIREAGPEVREGVPAPRSVQHDTQPPPAAEGGERRVVGDGGMGEAVLVGRCLRAATAQGITDKELRSDDEPVDPMPDTTTG